MRKQTSFNADITLPLFGVNNAYAKLYMPYNDNGNFKVDKYKYVWLFMYVLWTVTEYETQILF